ncbi:uncharacterized protein YhaN [Peribacillus deserti]|uniref:Uncharacterized protein YhaN n=1 Tax=Peribacillus deserti TaxID=673318 RepID=A0ABS2QLK3_9BACI|nr:AAA family ATPase [Peribacillus deserti]MBM7694052.1 uncharacterized protein YhaN [Peribacillus deserti]
MKIKELHIYGYGKIENRSFTGLQDLQVFFGENEAGKSTIMSFIHGIFFGFPTKQQNIARYEPKLHSKYGGRIVVDTKRYGTVSIERVKGKASGDVTVTLPGGAAGGEEILKNIVHGLDKTTFQSIYSFDLTGLQGLHKLNENDIGKYLLSAGMIGNDALAFAESKIQKEMDSLFKPAGQKPVLNVQLQELKQIQAELKKSLDVQKDYETLQAELIDKKKLLEDTRDSSESIENQLYTYKEYLRVRPLLEQKVNACSKLEEIGDIHFPVDGMSRLKELINLKSHFDAEEAANTAKVQDLSTRLAQVTPNAVIQEKEAEMQLLVEKLPLLEQKEMEREQVELQIKNKVLVHENLVTDIRCSLTPSEVMELDTSTFTREAIYALDLERQKSLHVREQLDERLKEARDSLESTEKSIIDLKSQLLPEEQKKVLDEKKALFRNSEAEEMKKELLLTQIKRISMRLDQQKKAQEASKKKQSLFKITALIFLGLLAAYAIYSGEYLLTGLSLLAGIFLLASRAFNSSDRLEKDLEAELRDLEKQRQKLDSSGALSSENWDPSMEAVLNRDTELRKLVRDKEIKYREQELSFNRIIDSFEKWEKDWKQMENRIKSSFTGLGFPETTELHHLKFIFDVLTKAKANLIELQQLKKDQEELTKLTNILKQEIYTYAEMLGASHHSWREAASFVKMSLQKNNETIQLWKQVRDQYDSVLQNIKDSKQKVSFIEKELADLFSQAAVKSEDEFRKVHKKWQEAEEAKDVYRGIEIQLANSMLSASAIEECEKLLVNEYTIANLEENRRKKLDEAASLIKRLAEIELKITQLEEGGTYSELLHIFHQKKSIFQEEAKKWAQYALAKTMLTHTINKFKNEKFPKVLEQAVHYFTFLTEGNYTAIHLNSEVSGLLLEHKSGILYEAGEVSRGTAEQAYAALRLALALFTAEEDSFPIIIDDGFVNFDQARTKRMLQLLTDIKKHHQIIFFTCHEHLLMSFSKDDVIDLQKKDLHTEGL